MSTPAPEKVFPKADAPTSTPSTGARGFKLDQKTAMWGGAVVVALIALVSARGTSSSSDDETSGGAYELDTTETDVYNDLQPELENIADQLEELTDRPRPATPAPATKKKRKTNKPGPKGRKNKKRPKATPRPKPTPKQKRRIPAPRRPHWPPPRKK